ncbi:hypothetical protein AVEN_257388-1 [Araneus ventricosus]|uniref:Uncharacterized protein n=1 Tax=Araneus ventricosus TaxID=182803 RepID=A0A4Y2CA17_ARAVE|nr:hypothetical protein AVEN_257388-1 [Araneus ventricosus]
MRQDRVCRPGDPISPIPGDECVLLCPSLCGVLHYRPRTKPLNTRKLVGPYSPIFPALNSPQTPLRCRLSPNDIYRYPNTLAIERPKEPRHRKQKMLQEPFPNPGKKQTPQPELPDEFPVEHPLPPSGNSSPPGWTDDPFEDAEHVPGPRGVEAGNAGK